MWTLNIECRDLTPFSSEAWVTINPNYRELVRGDSDLQGLKRFFSRMFPAYKLIFSGLFFAFNFFVLINCFLGSQQSLTRFFLTEDMLLSPRVFIFPLLAVSFVDFFFRLVDRKKLIQIESSHLLDKAVLESLEEGLSLSSPSTLSSFVHQPNGTLFVYRLGTIHLSDSEKRSSVAGVLKKENVPFMLIPCHQPGHGALVIDLSGHMTLVQAKRINQLILLALSKADLRKKFNARCQKVWSIIQILKTSLKLDFSEEVIDSQRLQLSYAIRLDTSLDSASEGVLLRFLKDCFPGAEITPGPNDATGRPVFSLIFDGLFPDSYCSEASVSKKIEGLIDEHVACRKEPSTSPQSIARVLTIHHEEALIEEKPFGKSKKDRLVREHDLSKPVCSSTQSASSAVQVTWALPVSSHYRVVKGAETIALKLDEPNLVALTSSHVQTARMFALLDLSEKEEKKVPPQALDHIRTVFARGQIVSGTKQEGFVFHPREGLKLKLLGRDGDVRLLQNKAEPVIYAPSGEALYRFSRIDPHYHVRA